MVLSFAPWVLAEADALLFRGWQQATTGYEPFFF